MDLMEISKKIQDTMLEIATDKGKLNALYAEESRLESILTQKKAITMMGLRNGKPYTLQNEDVHNPPVTLIPDIVKGICWQEILDRDIASGNCKATETNIRALLAILNGYQTIHKHLD